MNMLRLILGLVVLITGLLWVGQGLNYIKWPASSFMINQIQWAYYGGGLAIVGLILIIWPSRS